MDSILGGSATVSSTEPQLTVGGGFRTRVVVELDDAGRQRGRLQRQGKISPLVASERADRYGFAFLIAREQIGLTQTIASQDQFSSGDPIACPNSWQL
jgi:hypothetical protein